MVDLGTGLLRFRRALFFSVFLLLFAAILFYSKNVAAAALEGLKISAAVLIPSLFPLSVLANMIVRLGIAEPICKKLGKGFKKLFGVSGNGAVAFAIGILGGYPLGILAAADLYKCSKIGKTDLSRLVCFCSNCSPAFIFSVAAPRFTAGTDLRSAEIAFMLFSVHIASAVFTGILFKNLSAPDVLTDTENTAGGLFLPKHSFASAFTESVEASAMAMLRLTAYISLFYIINIILKSSFVITYIAGLTGISRFGTFAAGILEFSTGILSLDRSAASLPAASFMIGFGGLCVAAQSASGLRESGCGIGRYLLAKLFQAVTSYAVTAVILYFSGIA